MVDIIVIKVYAGENESAGVNYVIENKIVKKICINFIYQLTKLNIK